MADRDQLLEEGPSAPKMTSKQCQERQDAYEVNVVPRANLEHVDDPAFTMIIKQLSMQDIKGLRLCSRRLRRRVEQELHCKKLLLLTARCETDVQAMKKLQQLNLLGCRKLSDTGLLKLLAKSGDNLNELELSFTTIGNAVFESIHLPKLKKLGLRGCENIV